MRKIITPNEIRGAQVPLFQLAKQLLDPYIRACITEYGSGGSDVNPIVQSAGEPDLCLTADDFSRPLSAR